MDSEKIKALLIQALEKETPQERANFLMEVGADDPTLKAELESLLEAHEAAGDFLAAPAPELVGAPGSTPISEEPGTVIGRYKLLEKIGEGGMAVVYMAQQTRPLKRRVALKIIKLGMDTKEVIARFEVERQALAIMDHPNIAKVLDAGATDTGRPYFVMELVRGISITAYCDKNKLNTQDRLALFLPVCNAVHHAHQKGIIHRDLKPSNIMVTMHDGIPVPKVIDFGIAKATNQQLTEKTVFTQYAQMIGTPEYMSPEQAEMSGLDIDTRTDIYSLGIVLYELLTGTLPFDGETLRSAGFAEIQRIIREEEPLRPSTRISALGKEADEIAARRDTNVAGLAKRLYRELEWIPLKALRKDRTRRYTSASEFAQDIHNYLNDQPLLAGPESAFYRLRKMVHKYRVPVMTVSAIAVVSIVGLVAGTWLYVGRSQARGTISELKDQTFLQETLATVKQLQAEGRYQEALDEIETKFDGQELSPQTQLLRALFLIELGQFKPAEDELLHLTQEESQIAGAAHYLLVRVYLTVDPAKADTHRQLAESILPETAEAFYLRALTATSAEDALTWLSLAVEHEPKYYAAHQSLTYAYYSLKAFQRMAEEASILTVLHPSDYLGHALRAIALREMEEFELAIK
ncbi:MAG: serine/threonine protein kinase, partial [Phycisphaeraceae bacterium]|nr:serine/threonine protein kinase [Phycisphaeraceae bacterium]